MTKRPERPRCAHCGKLAQRGFPTGADWLWSLNEDEDHRHWRQLGQQGMRAFLFLRLCHPACFRAHLSGLVAKERIHQAKLKELSCVRKQVRALRRFLRTGDPAALASLPPGYGPARTSPGS